MKKIGLLKWFNMTEEDVIGEFATLPNSKVYGTGNERFVYIPGSRNDRVLLCAHSDTVFNNRKLDVKYDAAKGVFFSGNQSGIGADDRAGCSILYNYRNLGHSIVVFACEEQGCRGSGFASENKEIMKEFNQHRFAIEFDRMNDKDLVFYSCYSDEFVKWCENNFKGYKKAGGSYTDICEICKPMCGLNISIGYYGQHTSYERLVESEWHRTLNLVKNVLQKENLPEFRYENKPFTPVNLYRRPKDYSQNHDEKEYNDFDEWHTEKQNSSYNTRYQSESITKSIVEDLAYCKHCVAVMSKGEVLSNKEKCIYCNEILLIK